MQGDPGRLMTVCIMQGDPGRLMTVFVLCRVTQEDGKELKIATKKFQSGNIRYDLYDDASQLSNVFTIDNQGRISNLQVSLQDEQ